MKTERNRCGASVAGRKSFGLAAHAARINLVRVAALAATTLRLPAAEPAPAGQVDFARDVLPVLSDKCFVCHGPDTQKKSMLRLDSFEAATSDRGGYRAIDPVAPEQSELLARIHDASDPMPPEDAEKQLTPAERDRLSRWVRQGGEYALHWAFVPPQKPKSADPELAREAAIDALIQDGLKKHQLALAPEADRATLARRAALALTGLPPEPAQLAAFLAGDDSGAYERLVEELLASPRYGEHQARYWLDAVRYGDTHGLHLDNRRAIHPYRDWVVRAFNRNLPLDDFITWQLAGDLLPDPTLEQRVATGFVRMNPSTAEAGVLPEEFQAKNNFDRTETLGTVFLGMTLSCARCHTHKYDPITHTDYYRLLAFFNSTAENPLDGNAYTYAPVLPTPKDQEAWETWLALETESKRLLDRVRIDSAEDGAQLVARAETTTQWTADRWRISKPQPVDAPAPIEPAPPPSAAEPAEATVKPPVSAPPAWEDVNGLPGRLERKLPEDTQAVWVSFRIHAPVAQTLWLTWASGPGSQVQLDGLPVSVITNGPLGASKPQVPLLLAKGAHEVQLKLMGSKPAPPIEVRIENPWQALARSKRWEACDDPDRLLMLTDRLGPLAHLGLQEQALDWARRITLAKSDFTPTLVAEELAQPRPTHLLRRGEYHLPEADPLEPDVPAVMGSLPKDAPRNRLGLAQWLTARGHPLTARVLVNHLWQRVFGEGLVRTPEDFGLQGQYPTHPALLDWLAVELQENGWDMKHMLRSMVTSRTFRQRSAWREAIDDPPNRLWARGPSYRLDAEVLRDMGLWASDLLDTHMGGEGVKPYQPGGLWSAMAHPASNTKRYVQDHGPKLYRRSLYVYWKRTSPHPMMTLFDAPSRESSCVRRSRTSTSLQSLALLNETQRLEMSRALAERLLREASDDSARLNLLFRLLTCRVPTGEERAACAALLQAMRSRYATHQEDALALLAIGEAERNPSLDPAQHAAWTQVAVTVLASDAAITLY